MVEPRLAEGIAIAERDAKQGLEYVCLVLAFPV
jgi:hypothetical protein